MNDLHSNLQAYLDGELPSHAIERFHEHLVACAACQVEMRELLFLDLAAARAIDMRAQRPAWDALRARVQLEVSTRVQLALSALGRRWKAPAAFLGMAAVAAALVMTVQMRELWLVQATTRSSELRLPSEGYKPYEGIRGREGIRDGKETLSDPPFLALWWLGWRGQPVMIAEAYLLHDQPSTAEHWLERAGPSADALATRAALDLRQGRPEDAVNHASEALRLEEGHPAALWNRAMALRALGLPHAAANAFERVAALEEPGWADEARKQVEKLREESARIKKAHADRQQRCRAAMRGEQPYPLDLLERSGRLARVCFYDVLRSAGTVEAIAALEATAADLDARLGGGSALQRDVAAAKAGANERRAQLSLAYTQAIEADAGDEQWEALAGQARDAGQDDIELGALFFLPAGRLNLKRYQDLAEKTGDPWFATLAHEKAADEERLQGQSLKALELLRPYQERCLSQNRVEDRCLTVERSIAFTYTLLHQTLEAKKAARLALERARAEGDTLAELNILEELGQVARIRRELGLAQSYMEEVLERAPDSCPATEFARSEMAVTHQRSLDFQGARAQVDMLRGCDRPPSLPRMFAIADLQRRPELRHEDDEALLQRGADAIRANPANEGDLALVTHILGRAKLEHDRAEGERLLWQAIAEAGQLHGTDSGPEKAKLYSYTSLILDAGKREEYERALELFAAERHWDDPPPCSVWLTSDDERLLVLAVAPDGRVLGRYDGARTQPADVGDQSLVPPEMLQVVRACAAIQVIARPPLEGLPGLLPPDVPWSQVLHQGTQHPPGQGPRVVVASPTLPVSLGLPELSAPPRLPSALWLEGSDATPTRVLEAARTASMLELHVHGMVDPNVADASYLVLAPEVSTGRFALTARDVRKEKLTGHPLVLLAACDSGDTATDLQGGYGLAEAFVEAGARAVLAVNARVKDQESVQFFRPLLARIQRGIQAGVPPAATLRAAREEWHREHGSSWADQVVLFE